MRSVIRIPAMVPWVRPTPESPVTIKIFGSPGFLPMNASPSALFIIWPDQRNSGSPTSPKWGSLAKCVWASHATSSHCPRPHRRYFHRRKLIPQTPNVPSSLHPLTSRRPETTATLNPMRSIHLRACRDFIFGGHLTSRFRNAKEQPSFPMLRFPFLSSTIHIPSRSEEAERVSQLPLACPVLACVTMP